MVDQPLSPPGPRLRTKGKLSLPATAPGMNKLAPNERGIEGKGTATGPDIDADTSKAKPRSEGDEKILDRIRKRFERCISAEADNRKAAVDDRKFKAGNQWPADILAQRNADKRPALTINRMKTFVHQVTNPARENRPQINVSAVGGRSDDEGAKMLRGMIRAIERDSHADIAYDSALDDAVTSGWGFIRLLTEWKSETSFDQVLVIQRVRNPFTVYLDPDRQQPEGSDARFGIVTEIIPDDQFDTEYPNAQKVPYDIGGSGEKYRNWALKDGIRVAEYYEVVEEPRDLISISTGFIGWKDELGDILERRIRDGSVTVLEERKSFDRKVMYYKVTAVEILERNEWIGKWVPIVEVVGDEIDIEGKVVKSGVIRDAKDSQRNYNYWTTAATELVGLAPKTHWVMEEGQMEGHEQEWKNANARPRAALTYKGTSVDGHPAPPPQRIAPPPIPEGMTAMAQQSAQDMLATTGVRFDGTLQERMYDESGKALKELNRKTDIGAFHYYDNFRRGLEFLAKQIVEAICGGKVYTSRQAMTILREDDKEETVTLDPMLGAASKETKTDKGVMRYFNPKFGEYGVTVDIGPSYASKRQEASESMMDFVKALPNTAQLVMDLIASEMDWPGADKIAARLAKAIPAQFLTADLKDIPPQIQALIQNLEAQTKQLQGQLQQAVHALQDKQADRDVALRKIEADFEVKLLQVIGKTEETGKKLAMEAAKFTAETLIEEMRGDRERAHQKEMAEHAESGAAKQPKPDQPQQTTETKKEPA